MTEQVVEKALSLLPKYGGYVEGAVNKAILLLGFDFDKDLFNEAVKIVQEEVKWII